NEAGELSIVRGGVTALGYRKNDKATRGTFVDGWVHTGDHVMIDANGVLLQACHLPITGWYCTNLSQDTLQISGMRLCPVEIETMILAQSHKLITDVSVAGVSGRRTSDERVPRA
ncbi:hypothetical protein BD769DRAFT_1360065, partial [Suillus cothurnatus]